MGGDGATRLLWFEMHPGSQAPAFPWIPKNSLVGKNQLMRALRIPYQRQRIIEGSRTCGAAALAMVYRSLGLDCRQREVWDRVAEHVRPHIRACRTHRLALDALEHGLSAIVLQAAAPIGLLQRLTRRRTRVVLNHRLDADSNLGHFTVLIQVDSDKVVIHDPHFGPNREVLVGDLERLWAPRQGDCEIVGGVLVAIARKANQPVRCSECGLSIPAAVACERCERPIALAPAEALGCLDRRCSARRWARLFCPVCDWGAPFDKTGVAV